MNQVGKSEILTEWMNPHYLKIDIIDGLKRNFSEAEPFSHLELPNFINQSKIEELIDVLTEQHYELKEGDLFRLLQTDDFDNLDDKLLKSFKDFLRSDDFIRYMQYITEIVLSENVDAIGNIYRDTDYLLCHDDQLEERKIAYILYLTELIEDEGGSLNLFDTKEGYPNNIVKKIRPEYNKLVFFRVSPHSFHEVEEVRGEEIYRASISGWFNND